MNTQNSSRVLNPKPDQIIKDYRITDTVLGLGINGKVVQCYNKVNGQKYALKVCGVKNKYGTF